MAKDCAKILRLVDDYKSETRKDRTTKLLKFIAQTAAKAGIKKVATAAFGGPVGIAAHIVASVLMPNESIQTGSERFGKYLKDIIAEFDNEQPDIEKLNQSLSLLKDSYSQLLIEKDFGINSNCYASLKELIDKIEGEINSMQRPHLA